MRDIATGAIARKKVLIAVSIDISNAFNSIKWSEIIRAFDELGISSYLKRIIKAYLCDRKLIYANKNGEILESSITRGVSQGSVLGPLLWNMTYNCVLNADLDDGCSVICYADDTLVIAEGDTMIDTLSRQRNVAIVVNKIQEIGLEVSSSKTEAVTFYGRDIAIGDRNINVLGELIQVKRSMRYFGIVVDSKWSYMTILMGTF